MSHFNRLICIGLGLWLLCFSPTHAKENQSKKPWTGKLDDGQVITKGELEKIIKKHELWLESEGKKGEVAVLDAADLSGARLSGIKIGTVNLSKAYLDGANLSGASLSYADLKGANLKGANLRQADMDGANLTGAYLTRANLSGTVLIEANLKGAFLSEANLNGADLREANLSGAIIVNTNLNSADLQAANLSLARFEPKPGTLPAVSSLIGIKGLDSLTFDGTSSYGLVELREVYKKGGMRNEERQVNFALQHTRRVNSWNQKQKIGSLNKNKSLNMEELLNKILKLEDLVKREGLLPEKGILKRDRLFSKEELLKLEELLKREGLLSEKGILKVDQLFSKEELFQLEELVNNLGYFTEQGLFKKEEVLSNKELFTRELGRLENILQLVMFEWTCKYGMTPGRPLRILGLGIFLLTFPYFLALCSSNPHTGIWRLLPDDRVIDRKIKVAPVKLRAKAWWDLRAWGQAFYFSLLSAFHIGWRDLNVGSWIARLQRREYNLRATGWVRTVSGLQSLLSVYMLALWALCYFGRPFE